LGGTKARRVHYLGQTGETLAQVGARLGRVGGVPVTMPRPHYAALIAEGTITDADIRAAIETLQDGQGPDLAQVKQADSTSTSTPAP